MGLFIEVIDALGNPKTRPKAIQFGDGMWVYLLSINRNPDAEPEDMVSLRLWFTKDTIISAKRKNRRLLSVQNTKEI